MTFNLKVKIQWKLDLNEVMSKELANELVRTGGRYSRNLVITNLWEKVQNIRFTDYIALKSNSVVP